MMICRLLRESGRSLPPLPGELARMYCINSMTSYISQNKNVYFSIGESEAQDEHCSQIGPEICLIHASSIIELQIKNTK